jgi:uncharacterized membrane protein
MRIVRNTYEKVKVIDRPDPSVVSKKTDEVKTVEKPKKRGILKRIFGMIFLLLALNINAQIIKESRDTTKVKLTDVNTTDTLNVNIAQANTSDTILVATISHNTYSVLNSTSTPLGTDSTFIGVAEFLNGASGLTVIVYSNVASATDGLEIQQSIDSINWKWSDCFSVSAQTAKTFSFQPQGQYFRIKYTNGSTVQDTFYLQTTINGAYVKPSSHRIADSISDQDDAELVTNVNKAENPSGIFVNIGATESNNLRVTDAESGLAIAKGDVVNTTFIHKFGNAPDFDPGDGFVTVWDGADDGDIAAMQYTYSSTADIDSIVSSDVDDDEPIEVQGLNASYNLIIDTVTLNGQTPVHMDSTFIRVFRMKNIGDENLEGNVYCYTGGTVVLGVPSTPANVRAVIDNGNNQTLMAVYSIPAGKTGYMRDWYASTAGGVRAGVYEVELLARPFGGVFQIKHKASLIGDGTSNIQHKYEEPEVFLEKTDIEIRMNTDTNISSGSAGFDIVIIDN